MGLATVAVLATIQWGFPRFKVSLMEREPTEALRLLIPLVYAMPLGLVLVLLPLFRLVRHSLKSGRFPPPGTRLIRDMEILEGEPARKRARQVLFLLILIIGMMICMSLLTHTTMVRLIRPGI